MSWTEYRKRDETVRAVISHADRHRDGLVPMGLPGVRENFADELDLVAALQLRWHARLSGNVERALTTQPMALDDAVAAAWAQTARQLPGIRTILDRCLEHPTSPEMESALNRALRLERTELALAAGAASSPADAAAAMVGRRIEEDARAALAGGPAADEQEEPKGDPEEDAEGDPEENVAPQGSFVDRIRAAMPA